MPEQRSIRDVQYDGSQLFFGVSDAAALLGIDRRALSKTMSDGNIAYRTIGDRRCITRSDLLAFAGLEDLSVPTGTDAS